jgi:hypothetical protein
LTSYNGSNDYQLALGSANTFEWKIGRNNADGKLYFQGLNGASTVNNVIVADLSGNVGIGTSSPNAASRATILSSGTSTSAFGNVALRLSSNGSGYASTLVFSDEVANSAGISMVSGNLVFGAAGFNTERARIDSSGNLLVGTTSTGLTNANAFAFQPASAGSAYANHVNGSSSGNGYIFFGYNGGSIGSITQNGTTGVLYNLTSDYRLKNNQQALTGAKDFIMALQPKKWQWWDGSGEGVGFIAHEFMEVAKYSGQGEKDAVETVEIKDDEGNVTGTEQRPVYQSIQPSSSEVMANLVAFIQEQQALITALTTRITALESA